MTTADPQVALVTGAGGSIGRATIRSLAARSLRVVTADRRPLPEGVADDVTLVLRVDLTDDVGAGRALSELGAVGRLGHVIAVAGGGDAEELGQKDPATEPVEIFARVLENNLTSAFVTIRHTVPLLRAGTGDRSITLVGSINEFGGYGAPGYSAAKAGLGGLARALATPLGADGIRINCVALGTVDTDNLRDLADASGVELDLSAFAARAPLKRVLTPQDVASALTALALDMPGLTGATIVVDNGQTLIR